MKRIQSIDFARGLVMVIMALDHVRDLMHNDAFIQDPTDLNTTTPILFFTRWITHLCAPTFVFLSGVSVFMSFESSKNLDEVRSFLLKRGFWLLLLEVTVVNFGIWFDIHFQTIMFQVIGTIGLGFVLLSFLLKFTTSYIGKIGFLLLMLYPLLALIPFSDGIRNSAGILFFPALIPIGKSLTFFMSYPPIPWLAIMMLGFGFGRLFLDKNNKALFLKYGLIFLALFLILRAFNIYGDPAVWSVQKNSVYTLLSFFNVSKYPPSPLYVFVTLGVVFLLMWLAEGRSNKLIEVLKVYGKVPLFYYLIHWYVVHLTMFAIVFAQGYKVSDLVFGPFKFGRPEAGGGVSLPYVYLIWLAIVVLMYPLCKWYGAYKEANKLKKWLRYL
ncbi:MAG: DUF1624 domain-containing protein [Leadbetterella sp.]|nr:DUF1624 domain-containing protein [Leadbetterella sp.]